MSILLSFPFRPHLINKAPHANNKKFFLLTYNKKIAKVYISEEKIGIRFFIPLLKP